MTNISVFSISPSYSKLSSFYSNNISNKVCHMQKTTSTVARRSLDFLSESIKNTAYQMTLLIGKVIGITFLSCLIVATATLTALSSLTLIGRTYTLQVDEKPTLFHHFTALCFELWEILNIVFLYKIPYNYEVLQKADDKESSPEFILIEPPQANPVSTPIIYAPGYLDEPETLRRTCRELAAKTGSKIYLVNYNSRFQSIEQHAQDFNRISERAIADTKQSELVIAGHSMGGLVSGTYITQYKRPEISIKKWITIATPLKGTNVAYLGLGKCAEQMRPSSSFMQAFHQEDNQKALSAISSVHIYTKTDLLVPDISARKMHPHAQEHMSTKPYGHLGVRSCKETIEIIQSYLLSKVA